MWAKRWLIDTLPAPPSLFVSLSFPFCLSTARSLSLCGFSIAFYWPPITQPLWILQGPIFKNYLLNCVKSMDHCTFVPWEGRASGTGAQKLSKRKRNPLKCTVAFFFQCHQCLLQINSQTTVSLTLHPEYYQSLPQTNSQKNNHKKLPVI